MLQVGSFPAQTCQGVSRRAFLQAAASLPLAWPLAGTGGLSAAAAAPGGAQTGSAPAGRAAATGHNARSVLLIWLGGGPSHLDMFDPKPKAPAEYRGPFSAIATRTPGVRFSEVLPRCAARSDRFSLIRTNVNFDGDHLIAASIALTGTSGSARLYPPNYGAIVARNHGSLGLPPFVSLARGPIGDGRGPVQGYGGGTWGQAYDPFMVSCSEQGQVEISELKLFEGLTPVRLADRRRVLGELDRLRRNVEGGKLQQWEELHQKAYALLTAPEARKAFDLSQEPAPMREAYGHTSFGQSCLLGRRLVEAGVPYVQVNWSQYVEVFYPFSDYGWDTHADNFGLLADWHCPLFDRVFSTLLDDLRQRGLLETTLVLVWSEFGRTPRINSIGSRDHWHPCYFSLWAGGGVQPGRVIGESDPRAEYPLTEPITPAMVGATMLELAGVNSATRAELKVLEGARVIHELL